MLYTKKGDNGTTKLFNCPAGIRISKSSFIFEVLGTLDELNSSLGYVKVLSKKSNNTLSLETRKVSYEEILEILQQNLFCIQAELGGSDIHLTKNHINYLEKVIYEITTLLPPIKSFIITGGGETGAYLDISRSVARRAERQVVKLKESKERLVREESIIFLNYQEGYSEKKPDYQMK